LAASWRAYQEEAAEFFRSIGTQASTDVTVQGVRTKHAVDVLVEIDLVGFSVRWVIECKHWKDPVSKLHVLALREIVSDLGADRGVILCENGFQSGAYEAAKFTNVQVTSIAELSDTSKAAMISFRLRQLFDRSCTARERYWEIPKAERIARGLRGDVGDPNLAYTGTFVAEATERILSVAFRNGYPIALDAFDAMKLRCELPITLANADEVLKFLEPVIADLEYRLDATGV
jgi:restriction system protein